MSMVEVSVALADMYIDELPRITRRCRRAGLRVTQQLPEVGIIIGTVDSTNIEKLARIEGVASVEQSRSLGVPPPESEVQ
ncbi:MAG: hypothetical protein MUD01_03755 [Chloroflexaceae bacterium]|jgi:hypothetical protein|nr:hypothetical protein [Chloroflexaceae bacterium]